MLEQYLGESIKALKQYEKIEDRFGQLPDSHQSTITPEQLPVLYRKILLRGQSTLNNWVYAESSIVLNHIALEFRKDLLASTEPIGKLWLKYQVETCKTILETKQEKADDLAAYFNIQASDDLLTRTYKVNSNNRVTMLITEKFPMSFFLDM